MAPGLESALLERGGRRSGAEIRFRCAVHEDHDPSASFNVEKRVWSCQACGASGGEKSLCEALGIEWTPDKNPDGLPDGIPSVMHGARISLLHEYRNATGIVTGYAVRYDEDSGGKKVLPFFARENGRWKSKAPPEPRGLYGLHRLAGRPDDQVWVVEGEKCADALTRVGLLAVTNQGGSKAAKKTDWSPIAGRRVVIWPDNDDPGRALAATIRGLLTDCEIEEIDPASVGLTEKGADCADWLVDHQGATAADVEALPRVTAADTQGSKSEKKSEKKKTTVISPPSGIRAFTDLGNGERMLDRFGDVVRYATGRGWMVWDGVRWAPDADGVIVRGMAGDMVRRIREDMQGLEFGSEAATAVGKHAWKSEAAGRISAAVTLFAPLVHAQATEFDSNKWQINTLSGIFDIERDRFVGPVQSAMCSKVTGTAFEPGRPCPRWVKYLEESMPDEPTRLLLQRWAGSCLTGIVKDRCVLFLTGTGANGKTVFVETLSKVLGEYSCTVGDKFFSRKANESPSTFDLYTIVGARMICGPEIEDEAKLDTRRLKEISGGDRMEACVKHQMQFPFYPEGKPVLYANARPSFSDQSAGWRERLRIVAFPCDFPAGSPQRIENLQDIIFAEEGPGVLNWMMEGARMWLHDGIGRTAAIEVESEAEFRVQDVLGGFFEEVAVLVPDAWVTVEEVYKRYRTWAESEGVSGKYLWTKNKLSRELFKRGVTAKKNKVAGGRVTAGYLGIALLGDDGQPRAEDIRNRPASQLEIGAKPAPEPDQNETGSDTGGFEW